MPSVYRHIRTQNLPGLGRHSVLASILKQLNEGNHVSVVGPRYTGKSCLMRSLALMPALRTRFVGVALCDVRHEPIESNDDFFSLILRQLREDTHGDAEWREYAQPSPGISAWKALEDLVKALATEKAQMLVILDGLDEAAMSAALDVGAWNNLTRLIDIGGAQFVTATRDRLGELCLDPKSRGSHFFHRFQEPSRLPPVDDAELEAWLEPAKQAGVTFDQGARTELLNFTGGHPQLLEALLHALCAEGCAVNSSQVQTAARELIDNRSPEVFSVANELQPHEQEALNGLSEPGRIAADVSAALTTRHLIRQRKGVAECSSRLVSQIVAGKAPGEATFRTLFGQEAVYFESMAKALRLRLAQMGVGTTYMEKHTRNIVDNLGQPDYAIMCIRNVLDEALYIVHDAEIAGRAFPRFEMERNFPTEWREGSSHQNLWVIECLTFDKGGVRPQKVSRAVWVMLGLLYNAGNFANHRQRQEATVSFALSVATTAVELISEMKRCKLID